MVGVVGFILEVTVDRDYLLGIFAVDVVYSPIHPVVGVLGVAAYYWDGARLYCQGLASSIYSPVS